MSGVDTGGGGKGKRSVDQEVNMIPFIDLLMVTISFLLITAVWSSMARLNASAQVPSPNAKTTKEEDKTVQPAVLHVRVSDKDNKFVLQWQNGNKTDDLATIDKVEADGKFQTLEDAIENAYKVGRETQHLYGEDTGWEDTASKEHGGNALNQAILHVDNALPFKDVVKVIDAIYKPRRHVCFEGKPKCCGVSTNGGPSSEGCPTSSDDVPAFNVAFSAN